MNWNRARSDRAGRYPWLCRDGCRTGAGIL